MDTIKTDVAIIGGGVIGCGAAYYLARMGIDVVVVEAKSIAAMGSGRSLGSLRTQGRHAHEMPLALESKKIFPTLNDALGMDTEYQRNGHLLLAHSKSELNILQKTFDDQKRNGYHHSEMIGPEKVFQIVPDLPSEIVGGLYCPDDGHINPFLLTRGFMLAAKKHGAKIFTKSKAKRINVSKNKVVSVDTETTTVKANIILNATGVHARDISKTIGIDLPISSLIYEILVTEPLRQFLKPVLLSPGKMVGYRQTVNGNLLMGSSVPNDLTLDMTITREKLRDRAKLMLSVFPKKLKDISIIRSWAGLFDITPDLVPILDCLEEPKGYFLSVGFSGHGLAISPAVCKSMAELISSGKPLIDLKPFRYSRFAKEEISKSANQSGKSRFFNWGK